MAQPPSSASSDTLVARALAWWKDAQERWRRLDELHTLSRDEIDRMAHEVGLSSVDFLRVACRPSGSAELLGRRLEALHLDPADIRRLSPLLLGDLQRTCSDCAEKDRCRHDMAIDPLAPGWESYCPNSGTLGTLG